MTQARSSQLNIARAYRPQTFRDIVGQDLSVRMLQNSLYAKKIFPVYIFAGQRGCGKTSTARVFATALNCEKRSSFEQDPAKTSLPCGRCTSCSAMQQGHHPDFIEIDAASHTGVDHVRTLIESAAHLPLAGSSKVYLIDEVHMLSRAAFNAFLKVLEEPPAAVHFILATTEVEKIPDTVRSRAFQLFFGPLGAEALLNLLATICKEEKIVIDQPALERICREADYSARDAINLLERVRFAGPSITVETVQEVLGQVSGEVVITLFEQVLAQDHAALLKVLEKNALTSRDPHAIWEMLCLLVRALLWHTYGVHESSGPFAHLKEKIAQLAAGTSTNRLLAIMQLIWAQEDLFLKTSHKHVFVEMVLMQLCSQVNISDMEQLFTLAKEHVVESVPQKQVMPPPRAPSAVGKKAPAPAAPPRKVVPVGDGEKWPTAHLIGNHFDARVEIIGDSPQKKQEDNE